MANGDSSLDKKGKFSARDLIYLVGFLIIFVVNFVTNKVSTRYEIDAVKTEIAAIKQNISDNKAQIKLNVDFNTEVKSNNKLILYKLSLIMRKLKIEE